MVSVASLLNSEPTYEVRTPTPDPPSTRYTSECSPGPSERVSKKPKLAKDAPNFVKAKTLGEVRYSPFDDPEDEKTLEEMKRLNVSHLKDMRSFPAHIPYNSDKKQLFQKTGRAAFEVFQYTFQPPGHEDQKPYVVLWDYNIGLVRMTAFFKCCRFAKTVPSKMMALNPGLREICHSITGGAIVAQGYWVPYEAAKALAATFCYEFRYALVPVFGEDFPSSCVKPESASYGTMVIDERIIRQCGRDVEVLRSATSKTSRLEEKPTSSANSSPIRHPWHESTRSQNSFNPVNRPTSTPFEGRLDSPYSFLNSPMRTPRSSRDSSPAVSILSPISTPATIHRKTRLPSPRDILESRDRDSMAPSPPPNSVDDSSSDSDVSPKTTPRKRRFFPEIPESGETRKGPELHVNGNPMAPEDIEAAEILVNMRQSGRACRKRPREEE